MKAMSFLIAACIMVLAAAAAAQPGVQSAAPATEGPRAPEVLTQVITPTGPRQLITIATPPFRKTGVSFQGEAFAPVIERDLLLSGFFAPPANEQFARETMALDARENKIHAEEWRRIGVSFIVAGNYEVKGNEILAEVRVMDTAGLNYVFGKSYSRFALSEARTLAHTISNDIIERLTTTRGVANTQICFIRALDRYGKSKQVCVMDADGGNPRAVTPQGELTTTPCWGAHGTEIYYTTYRDYNPDLAGFILKTGYSWWISRQPGLNLSPAWSETRQKVVLTLSKDGNSEIYVVNRDGSGLTRLTDNPQIDSSPAWSPDGRRIAYTSGAAGSPQIYIMDVETRQRRQLTHEGSYNDGPAWSPDGEHIAYTARVGGESQIAVIRADGSESRRLTSSGNNEAPSWAPNGLLLAFSSDREGSRQIYTMFSDGTAVQRLTSGAPCATPDWGPWRQ
ncbi:MAG: hypothetical protein M1457_07605 [bacterium]|nr:hypothetical protein [bacterium]